jgi:hypothetical protein
MNEQESSAKTHIGMALQAASSSWPQFESLHSPSEYEQK